MTPSYLSVSGLKNYLTCPQKFLLAQVERLRPIVPKAFFAFGKAIHKGIEQRIANGLSSVKVFKDAWSYEEAADLQYNSKESHASLMEQGIKMLEVWEADPTTQELIEVPAQVETPVYAEVDGVPLYGIVDFISTDAVIDWKTAVSEYGEEKVLDLQLPFYSLLLGNPELLYGFGVLIKSKTPRVQYLFLPQGDVVNLKELIKRAWEGITAGEFPRIPNSTCAFCEYLPLCLKKEGAERLYINVVS